ncbi:MAG: 1-acyl-sn-glycerol-3-phosphate acyltransferase [Firmicutes bacterium]|nr:1-acyl-sn-glycerol-3-phosphate acyltransferase [Bacillota bacterium]
MFRTILWYGLGWAYLVTTCPMLWLARYYERKGQLAARDRLAERMIVQICRVLFRLTGSKIEISGLENVPKQGGVLFVSNHQGHMDSLIIGGYIPKPKGFISIVEVLKIPILSTWMQQSQCVFLDRSDPRQSAGCINQAVEQLKLGHSMVVFPEGKLSDDGKANEFQRGWLRMATRSGVPIVPVYINGSYRALSKDGSRVHAAKVECKILKPIQADQLQKNDEVEFIEKLRATILEHA